MKPLLYNFFPNSHHEPSAERIHTFHVCLAATDTDEFLPFSFPNTSSFFSLFGLETDRERVPRFWLRRSARVPGRRQSQTPP